MRRIIAGLIALVVVCAALITEDSEGGHRRKSRRAFRDACCSPQASNCCRPCSGGLRAFTQICLQTQMFTFNDGSGTCIYSANGYSTPVNCSMPSPCQWDGACGITPIPQTC